MCHPLAAAHCPLASAHCHCLFDSRQAVRQTIDELVPIHSQPPLDLPLLLQALILHIDLIRVTIADALPCLPRPLEAIHPQNHIDHKVANQRERSTPRDDGENEADVARELIP
jgi:hypothetical protein